MSEESKKHSLPVAELEDNIIKTGTILNISYHNILQALMGFFIVFVLCSSIPFIKTLKIGFIIFFGFMVVFVNLRGIKNRSILEFLFDSILFFSRKRKLHLRSPEYHRSTYFESDILDRENGFQTIMRKSKKELINFIEEYRTDKGGEQN